LVHYYDFLKSEGTVLFQTNLFFVFINTLFFLRYSYQAACIFLFLFC